MSISSDLTWLLVRNNNSFLVKRDGVQFSSEPFNVKNVNSYKFSGLANSRAIDLQQVKVSAKNGNIDTRVKMTLKRGKNARKPAASTASSLLTKHRNGKVVKGARAVRASTAGSHYRADIADVAVARYHKLHAATKLKKIVKRNRRRNTSKAE